MNPDIRYQVFISSTQADLEKERRMVISTLSMFGYIPACMEWFPSTDDEQFEYIKTEIERSDFIVVILKGRYGSGYTEMEFDYATSLGKPTLVFVYDGFEELPQNELDDDEKSRQRFKAFRDKVKKHRLISHWSDASDLQMKVIYSLTSNVDKYPDLGWVRKASTMDRETVDSLVKENVRLREKIESLPDVNEDLISGDDVITLYPIDDPDYAFTFTCNEVIREFKTAFLEGVADCHLMELVGRWAEPKAEIRLDDGFIKYLTNVITTQLEALGVIESYIDDYEQWMSESESFFLTNVLHWKMTDEGYRNAIRLLAMRKGQAQNDNYDKYRHVSKDSVS
jgi:hypothetical protein